MWKTGGRRLQAQLVSFLHRLIRGIAVVVLASSGSALAPAFASCVASLSCLPPSASSQGVRLSSTRAFLPEHLPTPAVTMDGPRQNSRSFSAHAFSSLMFSARLPSSSSAGLNIWQSVVSGI